MASAHRFIVFVVIAGAALAAVMAPRRNEWLAIMRDEHKQADIIAQLEPRLAMGTLDAGQLATLARSHADLGHYRRAAELFERYTALRPQDADAYAQWADLYRAEGNQDRRIAMLRRIIALRRDVPRAEELAGLYHERGWRTEELALLSDYEDSLGLAGGWLLRLAELRNASHDRPGALHALLRPEVTVAPGPEGAFPAERLYLADLLVADGRPAEAVAWGKRWIRQWREPWLAARLLEHLVHRLPVADGAALAEAVARHHPEIRLFLAAQLASNGAVAVARQVLAGWSNANPDPSRTEVAAYVAACASHDAPGLAFAALAAALARPAPDPVIVRYVDAIAAAFGPGALAPIMASLPRGVIKATPLLAAQLAWADEDRLLTRQLLAGIDPTGLTAPDRQLWLRLLRLAASPRDVFDILSRWRARGPLPGDLGFVYARVAGELGQERAYRSAVTALRDGR